MGRGGRALFWLALPAFFHLRFLFLPKATFYHLRKVNRISKYLSSQTAEMLVNAFVSSRLDYFHSLLCGLPKESVKK